MAGRTVHDLDPRLRSVLLVLGVAEGVLKLVALIDLARRPADQVHGPKPVWALLITLVNSVGAVPVAYILLGRARHR